ncbi:FAD-binding protein [Pseudomonas cavernicola]|uniref:FAD-binding protein n=1 Tax=Pseudomonas cavernicola TaxID=2320866 RepID=UPI002367FCCA|nr:FAD-binding protein [Pseudomonas cavernicola]
MPTTRRRGERALLDGLRRPSSGANTLRRAAARLRPARLAIAKAPAWLFPQGREPGGLAGQIGVDPAGLARSVERFNAMAVQGRDEDFHKGESLFDRYYGDPNVQPIPAWHRCTKGPFYAVRIDAGDIGTKGGLLTDVHARVLHVDGQPIAGLYAIGNSAASMMGRTYPGAGSTIGPAMTFGYLAANHIKNQSLMIQRLSSPSLLT